MFEQLTTRNPKYGWIPDLPDQRDYSYTMLAAALLPIPNKIDLRIGCSPIENQGNIGSCTACALVGNLEFLHKQTNHNLINFSKLFLYYNERFIRGSTNVDSGASLRDGIKSLVKVGDCLESIWPYKISKLKTKPSEIAYNDAAQRQITGYFRLHTLSEMKHTLSDRFPYVFGFAVYESFESDSVTKTGIIPLPDPSERVLGGHAIMAVGYDDSQNVIILRNSWGASWGDHGYGYMPYDYLTDKNLSSDFWTIRKMEQEEKLLAFI